MSLFAPLLSASPTISVSLRLLPDATALVPVNRKMEPARPIAIILLIFKIPFLSDSFKVVPESILSDNHLSMFLVWKLTVSVASPPFFLQVILTYFRLKVNIIQYNF